MTTMSACSSSTITSCTAPARIGTPAPRATLISPAATAASRSPLGPVDTAQSAMSRPSDETTAASRMPGTCSTRLERRKPRS